MKRFLSVLLVLCTVLSLFPISFSAQAQTLAKDESGAEAVSDTALSNGAVLTKYDALYVGANGAKTANGGSLLGLYTAFGVDSSAVTPSSGTANGLWKNKMDVTGGTDAVLRDAYTALDFMLGASGGVGYHMTATEWQSGASYMGVTLPDAWADLSDFTVEQVALQDAIASTSSLAKGIHAVRLDLLISVWLPADGTSNTSEKYGYRWTTGSSATFMQTIWKIGSSDYGLDTNLRAAYEANGNQPVISTIYLSKNTGTTHVSYGVAYDNGNSYSKEAYTLSEYAAAKDTARGAASEQPIFSLFNGVPGDVYAIRVYNCALTAAEKEQNRFADLAAYLALPLSCYAQLSADAQTTVRAYAVEEYDYLTAPEVAQTDFDSLCMTMIGAGEKKESLYVDDGLTYLLAAYSDYHTGYALLDGTYIWKNGWGENTNGTVLNGEGWYPNENGGFTIVKNGPAPKSFDADYGITLPGSALPTGDFTVEWVYNPVGLTTVGADGTLERYIDSKNSTGTYDEMGIAIGPLRALQFSCYRPEGKDGQMERRWYYSGDKDLGDLNYQGVLYKDTSWRGLAMNAVKTYSVTHDLAGSTSTYGLFDDKSKLTSLVINTIETSDTFILMEGLAGTAYSVRVYDRVLNNAEMAQNHAADVIYYYGLDASFLVYLYKTLGLDVSSVYEEFKYVSFDLTKEEAQRKLDSAVASLFMAYSGIGVRKTDLGAVRYYFTPNQETYNTLTAQGYEVEMGILADVGSASLPLYGSAAHRITADMESAAVANRPFFTENGQLALTVRYTGKDKDVALTPVQVRGYVRITDGTGESVVLYLDTSTDGLAPNSLFSAFFLVRDASAVEAEAELQSRIVSYLNRCYENRVVHLSASAAAGGDGSVSAPYHSFSDAFAACKSILRTAASPLRLTLLLADGEYGIYGTETLSDADMPYAHAYFTLASETGNAVLTTTKTLASSDFERHTDNIWVYQMPEDEDGSYPAFRALYVDGRMADVSYFAGRYDADEDTYVSAYSFDYDGIYETAKAMYDAGTLTETTVAPYPASRTDLVSAFETYRDSLLATGTATLLADPLAIGKLYFDLRQVECFRDDMNAYAAALQAKADAGDTAAAAALANNTWRRVALRHLNVEMHLSGQWWYNIVHLAGVDLDDTVTAPDGTTHVACYRDTVEGYHQQGTMANRYVCFRNAYEYLDTENEYFYDRDTGKLYFYTEKDMEDLAVARATEDHMLILEGVRNVTLDGITFTGTDDHFLSENGAAMNLYGTEPRWSGQVARRSALCLYDCYGLTVKNCTFTELACKGIYGEGRIENVLIEGCTFSRIAANAIYFGKHDPAYHKTQNSNENIRLIENHIHHIGTEYHNAAAVHMTNNQNCKVLYNTVHDCAYSAFSLGDLFAAVDTFRAGDAYNTYHLEVAYNYVTDFMTELGDGGAFYLSGYNSKTDDTAYFNDIHDNYVVMSNRTGSGLGWMVVGIYFDASSSNWKCYDNVIAAQSYGAVEGENDEAYAAGDPYTVELRRRRVNSTYIYLQMIANQHTHNDLMEGNYILNMRSHDLEAQRKEAYTKQSTKYGQHIVASRNVVERDTHYVVGITYIPTAAQSIARKAGCFGHKGDPDLLKNNDY